MNRTILFALGSLCLVVMGGCSGGTHTLGAAPGGPAGKIADVARTARGKVVVLQGEMVDK